MRQQFLYFLADLRQLVGRHKYRYFYVWLSRQFWALFSYRLERGLFLLLGKSYELVRLPLLPLLNLWQAYSNVEISYRANIGPGIKILHCSGGVVISRFSVIGSGLTLTGGNVIGAKRGCKYGQIVLGNKCVLGANATVIGPVIIADFCQIGASACVIHDALRPSSTLVGVPAKALAPNTQNQD